ncbi:MAG: ATP-grasp domain-containing protein [Deltaproteobacteria bacterium]|nr:ATP-grasp domain-containing protein [Deltaproteobacteria bacterium]
MTSIYIMLAYAKAAAPPKPVLATAIAELRRRGYEVLIGVAETQAIRPERLAVAADLYVLKSHSSLWLALSAVLHAQGARILNPYPACSEVMNKVLATWRLAAAGVPTPRTWVTGDLARLSAAGAIPPLVLKPNLGGRGVGVRVLHDKRDLDGATATDGMLVQEFVPGDPRLVKLYGLGDEVFGVRRDADGTRRQLAVRPGLAELARRCARAFGLALYGVDVIDGDAGPTVIDVNYFPSYTGVPRAGERLAEFIAAYANGRSLGPNGSHRHLAGGSRSDPATTVSQDGDRIRRHASRPSTATVDSARTVSTRRGDRRATVSSRRRTRRRRGPAEGGRRSRRRHRR